MAQTEEEAKDAVKQLRLAGDRYEIAQALVAMGFRPDTIAEAVGTNFRTVYRWLDKEHQPIERYSRYEKALANLKAVSLLLLDQKGVPSERLAGWCGMPSTHLTAQDTSGELRFDTPALRIAQGKIGEVATAAAADFKLSPAQ